MLISSHPHYSSCKMASSHNSPNREPVLEHTQPANSCGAEWVIVDELPHAHQVSQSQAVATPSPEHGPCTSLADIEDFKTPQADSTKQCSQCSDCSSAHRSKSPSTFHNVQPPHPLAHEHALASSDTGALDLLGPASPAMHEGIPDPITQILILTDHLRAINRELTRRRTGESELLAWELRFAIL